MPLPDVPLAPARALSWRYAFGLGREGGNARANPGADAHATQTPMPHWGGTPCRSRLGSHARRSAGTAGAVGRYGARAARDSKKVGKLLETQPASWIVTPSATRPARAKLIAMR